MKMLVAFWEDLMATLSHQGSLFSSERTIYVNFSFRSHPFN